MYVYKYVDPLIETTAFVTVVDIVRPEGFDFAGEMHDFWELVFLKEGRAIATAEERVYTLQPGQLLFHKPMEFHRIRSAPGCTAHIMNLSFRAAGAYLHRFENRCLVLSPQAEEAYAALCRKVTAAIAEERGTEIAVLRAQAAAMLELFLLSLPIDEPLPAAPLPRSVAAYRAVVETMNAHCEEALSLADIAALCDMSVSNMKRIFSLYADKGISKYFLSLKLRRAMELLTAGMTAAAVADRLGFSSPAYFHTVFHRETGMTPAMYRKAHS